MIVSSMVSLSVSPGSTTWNACYDAVSEKKTRVVGTCIPLFMHVLCLLKGCRVNASYGMGQQTLVVCLEKQYENYI